MPTITVSPPTPCGPYAQILRSTAMIGGSSLAVVALGAVRTKAMAMLLGPAGVGLLALYASIADLAQSLAGMGVNSSGVRQIAAGVGAGDTDRIARTAAVLRWTSLVLGVLGSVALLASARGIATVTFGGADHAPGVALLSVAVLLHLIGAGQAALIQGLRRIGDLAMLGVLGALGGTILTIVAVYALREDGVVPSLVAVAATGMVASWWYSRRARIPRAALTLSQAWPEARALLKLGVAFMASGLLTVGSAYVIRITLLRTLGVEAAGFYHAAWTVGGLYVAFVLQAMGADFYPRLAAAADDHPECNRMVNGQAHVSVLLAGPGVIATVTGAPLIMAVFYSASFAPAVDVLRWICLGMALRVITWPVGFVLVAKGAPRLFLGVDLTWTLAHVGLAWLWVRPYGIDGAGIAFLGAYVVHGLVVYPLVRRLTGFRWSSATRRSALLFLVLIAATFSASAMLPPAAATGVGAIAFAVGAAYSLRVLGDLVRADGVPRGLGSLVRRFGAGSARARAASRHRPS